jgi:hypothetical protein
MASGITVLQPKGTSLTVVTSPNAEARPQPLDKTYFNRLIELRWYLRLTSKGGEASAQADARLNTLLKSPKLFTQQAVNDLAKGIAADDQRRKEEEAAQEVLRGLIHDRILEFQTAHPEDALAVLKDRLKALEKAREPLAALDEEIETVRASISGLTPSPARESPKK